MSLQPFKLVLRERQILSIGESNICMSSWTKRWVCSTQNHSISPNMPVSLSLSTGRKKGNRRNSTTVTNRWSKSLSFLCASNMTSALWVSQVSCSKCTHTRASTKGQMTIVAYSWKMWMKSRPAAVHSQPEKISFRVIKIMWYNSITSGQHPDSHIQAETACVDVGGGNTIPDPCFLLIGALDSQQTPFNGARRPPGRSLKGWSSCGCFSPSQPRSHPILSVLQRVGIGSRPPGPTLWSFIDHAIMLSSSCWCCFLLFFPPFSLTTSLAGVGDVLILASYQELSCEFSSATRP